MHARAVIQQLRDGPLPDYKTLLAGDDFTSIDTETTGLDWTVHDMLQFGGIRINGAGAPTGNQLGFLVRPRVPVGESSRIHARTNEELASHPDLTGYAGRLSAYLKGRTIVAHQADFDVGHINAAYKRRDLRPPVIKAVICTKSLFQHLFPGRPSSLDPVCDFLGLSFPNRDGKHDAVDDAVRCAAVFGALRRIWLERHADQVAQTAIENTEIEIVADASAAEGE